MGSQELGFATKEAQAILFFKHMDRVSAKMCEVDRGAEEDMDVEVIHAETLIAFQAEEDNAFQQEIQGIRAEYSPDKRPQSTPPTTWRRMKRQMELRAIFKCGCRQGILIQRAVENVPDAL